MAGGAVIKTQPIDGGFLTGRRLIFPFALITSLFFLWDFSYGLLDVLNKHFQTVLDITKLESTGLQIVYFGGGYLCFSPIAAEVMKRKAIFFWPTAHFSSPTNQKASFGGFIACTFVIACGLATLETAANSCAVVIGDPASASARLQFCQSWNGVASFIGPLIASKFMVYVTIAIAFNAYVCAGHGPPAVGVLIAIFFFEVPMYPTIFTLGTANLGRHTRRGAGILVMGLWRISYIVPLVGFVYVLGYVTIHWICHGFQVRRAKAVASAEYSGGALGGVVENVHFDSDKQHVQTTEHAVREGSVVPARTV